MIRLNHALGIAQRRPPLIAADAAEIGRLESPDQVADLDACKRYWRDDLAPHLTQAASAQPTSRAAS